MSAERIVELEIKVTYQERLLQDLNDVVTEQTRSIDALEKRIASLEERLRAALSEAEGD